MEVQKSTSTRISATWEPIHSNNSLLEGRMRAGRLASRDYANAVMSKVLQKTGLPSELVHRTAAWLKVVDQETRGNDEGAIRQLGAAFDLDPDRTGEALCKLKVAINDCQSLFANAAMANWRNQDWASHLFDVEAALRTAHAKSRAELPPKLSSAIDQKLSAFELKIAAEDWDACCEIMTAVDHLVSDELVETPSASHVG
jgi:hypothetical protein